MRNVATQPERKGRGSEFADMHPGEETSSTKARPSTGAFVRRGYDVVLSLGALPASCELIYQEGDFAHSDGAFDGATSHVSGENDSKSNIATEAKVVPFRSSAVDSGSIDGDPNGLFVSADDVVDDTTPMVTLNRPAPAMPEDPEWGKASYRRPAPNIARRAILFDLPDPRVARDDPFVDDVDGSADASTGAGASTGSAAGAGADVSAGAGTGAGSAASASRDSSLLSGIANSISSGGIDDAQSKARSHDISHDHDVNTIDKDLSAGSSAARSQSSTSTQAQSADSRPQSLYIEDDIAAAPQPVNPFGDDSGIHPSIQDDIAVIDPSSSENLVVSDVSVDVRHRPTLFSRLKQRRAHLQKLKHQRNASSPRRRDASDRRNASRRRDAADNENWKGGAVRPPLSVVEGGRAQSNSSPKGVPSVAAHENDAAVEERKASSAVSETHKDLRDAVLRMGDDKLICHDVWSVATGASAYDQAGIKAFLAQHRRDIRGAFLFNLESVGAGSLTVLDDEGFASRRRADRRLERLVQKTATDLHIPLDVRSLRWRDTDATPAMRASMRSVTLMGMQDGRSAFSRTPDDREDAVDSELVHDVVQLICEAIRRS